MPSTKGITRRDKLDMMTRRARGETLATIAEAYDVSIRTVRHHLTYEPAPRVLAPCGTAAAWRRHRRHGERPCLPCTDAWNETRRAAKAAAA